MRDMFWRKHPFERDVWVRTWSGTDWELRKRPSADPPGWLLYGMDADGTVTAGVWMGLSAGAAKYAAERWITAPADREGVGS